MMSWEEWNRGRRPWKERCRGGGRQRWGRRRRRVWWRIRWRLCLNRRSGRRMRENTWWKGRWRHRRKQFWRGWWWWWGWQRIVMRGRSKWRRFGTGLCNSSRVEDSLVACIAVHRMVCCGHCSNQCVQVNVVICIIIIMPTDLRREKGVRPLCYVQLLWSLWRALATSWCLCGTAILVESWRYCCWQLFPLLYALLCDDNKKREGIKFGKSGQPFGMSSSKLFVVFQRFGGGGWKKKEYLFTSTVSFRVCSIRTTMVVPQQACWPFK